MKCTSFSLILVAIFAGTVLAGIEKAQNEQPQSALQKLVKISSEQAQTLALLKIPGKIIEGKLEVENGLLIYSYDVQTKDGKIIEIQINAKDGSVVDTREETPAREQLEKKELEKGQVFKAKEEKGGGAKIEAKEDREEDEAEEKDAEDDEASELIGSISVKGHTNLAALAKIAKDQANASALKLVEGKVEKTELENEDGYLVYKIKIDFNGIEYQVLVDAGNGKVLEIEIED